MINHFKDTYERELEFLRNTKKPIIFRDCDSKPSSTKSNLLKNGMSSSSSKSGERRPVQLLQEESVEKEAEIAPTVNK